MSVQLSPAGVYRAVTERQLELCEARLDQLAHDAFDLTEKLELVDREIVLAVIDRHRLRTIKKACK
jgi:hypothetical protein